MNADSLAYLTRSLECLDGAESEFAAGRYNNCANRCYYAMFQAAITALIAAGVRSTKDGRPWEHDFVQAQFARILIQRRKLYPADLVSALPVNLERRVAADYGAPGVSKAVAERALRTARVFVGVVKGRLS